MLGAPRDHPVPLVAAVGPADDHDNDVAGHENGDEHGSSWVLGLGTLGALFGLATPIGAAWIANGLLLALFLSEVANYALRVFYYRRGI